MLIRDLEGAYYQSTGGPFTLVSAPPIPAGATTSSEPSLVWTPEGLLTRNGSHLSLDLGTTWQTSGLPSASSIYQVLTSGSKWLVGLELPYDPSNPNQPSRQGFFKAGSASSFQPVHFPSFQDLYPTEPVTLPAGVTFPLGVLQFGQ
jgi:hypothetical protein